MFNKQQFKAKMVLEDKTMKDMAAAMGINEATLNRKVNGHSEFTRDEIQAYRTTLGLNAEETDDVFFAPELTET